jgi:hypothetical protein
MTAPTQADLLGLGWGDDGEPAAWVGVSGYGFAYGDAGAPFSVPPGGSANVTVALTGLASTTKLGSLAYKPHVALTRNYAIGHAGTVVASTGLVLALTGNHASSATGSLTRTASFVLPGNHATGAVGTLARSATFALSGNFATGNVGDVTYSAGGNISVVLRGVKSITKLGTLHRGNTAFVLARNAATGHAGTVSYAPHATLTGNHLTTHLGSLALARGAALTGAAGHGQVGQLVYAPRFGLTHVTGTSKAGTIKAASTVTLTGGAATGRLGTLALSHAQLLSNVHGTGKTGLFGHGIAPALTGTQAVARTGQLNPVHGKVLAGNHSSGHVGTFGKSTGQLTGVRAVGHVGVLAGNLTLPITGVRAAGHAGQLVAGALGGPGYLAILQDDRALICAEANEAQVVLQTSSTGVVFSEELSYVTTPLSNILVILSPNNTFVE